MFSTVEYSTQIFRYINCEKDTPGLPTWHPLISTRPPQLIWRQTVRIEIYGHSIPKGKVKGPAKDRAPGKVVPATTSNGNINLFNNILYCVFSLSSATLVTWVMRIYMSLIIILDSITQVSAILPALFSCLAWYARLARILVRSSEI